MNSSLLPPETWKPLLDRLVFARHGRTGHNLAGRLQGSSDMAIGQAGAADAVIIAANLPPDSRGTVYTSPLLRAKQTAEIIARQLSLEAPVVLDDLREYAFGEWEGQTHAELASLSGHDAWYAHPLSTNRDGIPPGSEDFLAFLKRVNHIMRKLTDDRDSFLVVSHATVVRAIAFLAGLSKQGVESLDYASAASSEDRFYRIRTVPHHPFRIDYPSLRLRQILP